MATPDYVLNESFSFGNPPDDRTLEVGTFVRPIDPYYLPKSVKEDPRWKWMDLQDHTFCYTFYGIIPIPKSYIRKV